jgi:hypothetical protein
MLPLDDGPEGLLTGVMLVVAVKKKNREIYFRRVVEGGKLGGWFRNFLFCGLISSSFTSRGARCQVGRCKGICN